MSIRRYESIIQNLKKIELFVKPRKWTIDKFIKKNKLENAVECFLNT